MSSGLEQRIRTRGAELGFGSVGFSRAGPAPRGELFQRWLRQGYAGEMTYLEHRPDSRADVTIRSPWARTVVSTAMHYAPGPDARRGAAPGDPIAGLVSSYARGQDYHKVLKDRLEQLARFIRAEGGARTEARPLVDTSAILERDHASAGGLGWTAKNAMVIDPEAGSYFFLGEILTSLELDPGGEMDDLCGGCTRCIDACPTQAILDARTVDARRCISYLTIELKGSIPVHLREPIGDHLFGCDVCQEVCPWNQRPAVSQERAFDPVPAMEELTLAGAARVDDSTFAARFRGTALQRTKRRGFVRNALIVAANQSDAEALRAGREVLCDPDPMLRETAVWALAKGEAEERRAAALAAERETDPSARALMQTSLEGQSGAS